MRKLFFFCAIVLGLYGCAKVEVSESMATAPEDLSALVPLSVTPAPAGGPVTVLAGFAEEPGTRSRLEVGASAAQVLWTAGDSFNCLYTSNGMIFGATFTTQDDGVSEAAFTSDINPQGTDFHCFYPNANKFTIINGDFVFGMNLPVTQQAVAGGIAEGLNRAYAYTDNLNGTMDEKVRFYNLPALLKFRMDGAVVSRVRKITFYGTGDVAGDIVLYRKDGMPAVYPNISFSGDERSSKVILQGEFAADTDYFIALWPGQMSAFRMEFSDGETGSTMKYSSKSVTFERSRIKDFGTIHLGDDFGEQDDTDYTPVLYMAATEGTKPVTIAVIPEGFTPEEMPLYEMLAKSGLNALFDTEPYKTYRNRFNAYILKVPSRESGASVTDGNGNVTTTVATYFNARWGQDSYMDMRADDATVFDFVKETCPDIVNGIHPLNEVPILMIINDKRYGGICWNWGTGEGYGMVPYTDGGGGLAWGFPGIVPNTDDPLPEPVDESVLQSNYRNTTQEEYDEMGYSRGDWRNTLVHEFGGHCFGRLGDEYWNGTYLNYNPNELGDHTWPVPYSLNLGSDPASVPWKEALLDRQEALTAMDPHYGRIGVFQGGGTYLYGRWRSEKISCMIDNRFYFSAWQRYLITQRIFTLSDDLDNFSFESWLEKDVTTDPVRDVASGSAPGGQEHRTYRPVPPLPPPVLIEK